MIFCLVGKKKYSQELILKMTAAEVFTAEERDAIQMARDIISHKNDKTNELYKEAEHINTIVQLIFNEESTVYKEFTLEEKVKIAAALNSPELLNRIGLVKIEQSEYQKLVQIILKEFSGKCDYQILFILKLVFHRV